MPAPAQLERQWWQGTGASIAVHCLIFGLLIFGALHARQVVQAVQTAPEKFNIIFLDKPGPGGGGGGSPQPKTQAPPKPAKIVAVKPPTPTPIPTPADVPDLNVLAKTPDTSQMVAGALVSDGSGIPNGIGNGMGPGIGNGVGPGSGDGCCDGAYQEGNGITSPELIHDVKPNYTGDAMRAKIQGTVDLEAVVMPDGTVQPTTLKVTRSLDPTFGLDQEAKKAVRQWRFRPGICNRQEGCGGTPRGQAVPVMVVVELTFTLR